MGLEVGIRVTALAAWVEMCDKSSTGHISQDAVILSPTAYWTRQGVVYSYVQHPICLSLRLRMGH